MKGYNLSKGCNLSTKGYWPAQYKVAANGYKVARQGYTVAGKAGFREVSDTVIPCVCKTNAREFVACPKNVPRSAHTRFVSAEGPPPLAPRFQCCQNFEIASVLSVRNKRPIMFNRAAELQHINIELGDAGGGSISGNFYGRAFILHNPVLLVFLRLRKVVIDPWHN